MSESQTLPDADGHDTASLTAFWKRHDGVTQSPQLHRDVAERFLELGEPLLAYDAACDGLKIAAGDVRLRQLRGMALSRSGVLDAASAAFRELAAEGCDDEETLANLARTYKAMWLRTRGAPGADALRRQAYDGYLDAYRRTGGYWSAINAAALALAGNDRAEASRLAGEALGLCQRQLAETPAGSSEYWLRATCGEAALIAGNVAEATTWYSEAAAIAGRRYANLASTRTQARLVCELANIDWDQVKSSFALPRVVVFTGHMIDAPDRRTPRFPPELVPAVRREIDRRLAERGAVIGYSSAACGADLLFLEALAERGNDAVVVLPFTAEQFVRESVNLGGPQWRQRFDAAIARAGEPIIASSWNAPATGAAYDYANRLLSGLAKIQADFLDVPVELLAVWDGQNSGRLGGSATLVEQWRKQGLTVEHIDVTRLRAGRGAQAPQPPTEVVRPSQVKSSRGRAQEVVAMLFADVRDFHRLNDEQILPFVERFLASVASLMQSGDAEPMAVNTWGDGIFASFRGMGEAGRFALKLAELVVNTHWEQYGLPNDLSIRIALHAGPVYSLEDPVTKRPSFWGGHVSRAARIEPITPPGNVYASLAFAALARDEGHCEFTCEYVGQTPLAKGYGTFPTYHVRPRDASTQASDPDEQA